MPSVPITFVVAFILGGICVRMCLDGARTLEFIVLVGLCTAHMALISLAEHYDLSFLRGPNGVIHRVRNGPPGWIYPMVVILGNWGITSK